MRRPRNAVSRRALLGGTAAIALPVLGGCGHRAVRSAPELSVLVGAIASEQDLIALYEAARGAHAGLAGRIDPALAHHREHLTVLRRYYVPGSGRYADAGATIPPPRSQQVPGEAAAALAALRRAESQAAAARVTEVGRAGPGLAQLLASIGACEAGHVAALARTS